jgi:hypothetical protein
MTLQALDRAVLVRRLAQIVQLRGAYVPKTGQTGQTDQRTEDAWKFGAAPGQKLTSPDPKLTTGTAQQPNRCVQVVGAHLEDTDARTSGGAPQP